MKNYSILHGLVCVMLSFYTNVLYVGWMVVLRFHVSVKKKKSVMTGRSHRFPSITSTFGR